MFVEFLFAQNAMHQQLTYRNELTDRTKLLALLAIIHRHRLQAQALRELVRSTSLLFSTVLFAAHDIATDERPDAVDPDAVRAAHDTVEVELIDRAIAPDDVDPMERSDAADVARPRPTGLARIFRRG